MRLAFRLQSSLLVERPATAVAGGEVRHFSPRDRSRGAFSRH